MGIMRKNWSLMPQIGVKFGIEPVVLSNDNETKFFGENIVAVNVNMYLG